MLRPQTSFPALLGATLLCAAVACTPKTPDPTPQPKREQPTTDPAGSPAPLPDACAKGPKLEPIELPASFSVALAKIPLGTLTVSAQGEPSFAPSPDAPAAKVAAFQERFDAASGSAFAGYSWSKETREGETYGCRNQVPKGSPNYPAALLRALGSQLVGRDAVSLTPSKAAPAPTAVVSVELSRIHWSSSNPSLGPHEVTSDASIGAASFASPEQWAAETTKLIDETQVNGVASLREFLAAHAARDLERLKQIDAANNQELEEGGGVASVEFSLASGESIRIPSLKQTILSGYWQSFWTAHLRERITKFDPGEELRAP